MCSKRIHLYLIPGKYCSLLSFCVSVYVCVFVFNVQDRRGLAKTPTMSRRGRSSLWSMLCMLWHTRSTTWTRTSVPTTRGSAPRWSTREAKSCSSTYAVLTSTVSWDRFFSSVLTHVAFFHLISLYIFFFHSMQIKTFFVVMLEFVAEDHVYLVSIWKHHVVAKANRQQLPKDRNLCCYFRIPSRRLISYGRNNWVKA